MPTSRNNIRVVSASLPRDLMKRANALIPKNRRSRVIANMLAAFLDSVSRKQLDRDYAAYYSQRSDEETKEERDLLADWELSDSEAWAINTQLVVVVPLTKNTAHLSPSHALIPKRLHVLPLRRKQ